MSLQFTHSQELHFRVTLVIILSLQPTFCCYTGNNLPVSLGAFDCVILVLMLFSSKHFSQPFGCGEILCKQQQGASGEQRKSIIYRFLADWRPNIPCLGQFVEVLLCVLEALCEMTCTRSLVAHSVTYIYLCHAVANSCLKSFYRILLLQLKVKVSQ